MSMEAAQKKTPAQIVRLDIAFKMAGQWVNNMSKAVEDEPAEVESEGRPSRLGLGAKEVPRHSKARLSNDPVERRLYAKLEAGKRRAAKLIEDSIVPARDCNEDDDSDGELESRTSTFAKKRPGPQVQSLQVKKKQNSAAFEDDNDAFCGTGEMGIYSNLVWFIGVKKVWLKLNVDSSSFADQGRPPGVGGLTDRVLHALRESNHCAGFIAGVGSSNRGMEIGKSEVRGSGYPASLG
ncbi:hypothetical protein D5086_029188 [Populus alba]|uniref:Uncharacterized protein n=1 Tax=Populus alba TaxID=43335 RepID=A0ACC4AU45_POPAL